MKVKFITFGCSRNQVDTELMKGLLRGHELVEKGQDVTVVNTCFVKYETEKKVLKLLNSLKGRVVVTGCLSQARPGLIDAYPTHSFLGVNALERISEAVKSQVIDLGGGVVDFCKQKVPTNPLISIIPISDGCLGDCAYCCTKQARGSLKSRSKKSILNQFKQDLSKGAKEFWITGQDTGCYGFDIGESLPSLLNELTRLKGEFRIRVGMMNPEHALRNLAQLKKAFSNDKIYKFIHLPVQSGSNKVLKDMNRGYTVSDFKKIVKVFNRFNISTDIICGYPTETDKDWQETIKLIKEVRPSVLNISRFFARPGTKASYLKQLHSRVSKERSRELTRLIEKISLEDKKRLIGKMRRVLVTSKDSGRDEYYNVVKVKAPPGFSNVRVESASTYCVKAKII